MKKLFLPILFMLIVSAISAQVTVSYNIGKSLNKVSVGYRINSKILPYFGFQYLGGSITGYTNDVEEFSVSGSAFMPNIGIKYYLIEKESIKAGLNLGFHKPFFSVNSSENEIKNDINNELDNASFLISELGFISEYFISPAFSIGGEFGFRYLFGRFENNNSLNKYKSKLHINHTFTSLSLSYHF